MCDELTEKDNERFGSSGGALNRRDFSKLSVAAIMAMAYPASALGQEPVTESDVMVDMPDGVSDCYYVRPTSGKHPAVLLWPDIKGLRPAFRAMGKRLAMAGYSVLVVNPFYRDATAPVVGPDASFRDPDTRAFLIGMARKLTQDASMSDARAYISFLDAQDSVDTNRKVGTMGYCMGGPLIMRTAGAVPDRVGAAASFHGGGLVTDREDSPHLLIPTSPAHVLHAVAENDDERNPDAKNVLAAAYKAAGVPAEIEVYEGTLHGWCPPDSQVYNQAQAEKAWSRLSALFKTALA
ncbi:dienelactone hydrolase family protein [Kordiimonas aquimaris]|uniref:dienelactone hydrolase family protein n=1 Tax=Kordiimonas aquimaris TaxID=707591 RepID=UPI0021D13845|nr:dienelactone hydrolase family protein [Kordiimonas aquimaris]